ncbi:MAG TPA: AMP-binding protein, partial [Candidatus Deferrimicrobium sp.]|nr:AMP-binding protein [Candidatus Deferrimicrobium sp.]
QVQSFQGRFLNFAFNREETLLLKKAAIEGGVTLYLLLVTIFDIFLYKLSGQEDIVLGTPIAGRRHADLQAIVGMFVNTLLLRNFPAGEKNFVEFLEEVKIRTLRAFENQDYQFEDLVEKVAIGRDPGRNPLFDVMFTWQEQANKKDDSVSRWYEGQVSRFDMTWFASEKNDCISLGIEYCTQLFKPETIIRFSGYFKKIAAQIIVAPGAKIAEIDFVPEEEKKQLLYAFNHPDTDYPGDKTIAQLFAAQVERTPDHMAIFSHGRTLLRTNTDNNRFITYRQLDKQSGRLTGVLAARGIQPGEIVGIMIERSIEMIIGILGILKSGCAYLPINPGFPQERIDYMLKDSATRIIIIKSEIRNPKFETNPNVQIMNDQNENCHFGTTLVLNLENLNFDIVSNFEFRASNFNPSNLAYIIYTSGSTGNPKGVPITDANLSPLLHWGYRHLEMNEKDRAIQNLSYYFDWSVWEIFITLTTGAGLFMITEELLLNPEKSAAFIQQHAITILHVTPTQYR